MSHKFLIHEDRDNVGVAVSDIERGEKARGISLAGEKDVEVEAQKDVPLAHKIALKEIAAGSEIVKYGVVIGKAKEDIKEGDYVHDHNISSVRWNNNE